MRVTVTGATGLIGRQVVAALLGREDTVTVLSRRPERAKADLSLPTRAHTPIRRERRAGTPAPNPPRRPRWRGPTR